MRTLILAVGLVFCAACRVSCADSDRPLDASLWSSAADLSPYYRAAIREATEKYRGDIVNEVTKVVTRIYVAGRPLLWAQVDPDPFPAEFFSLRNRAWSEDARSTSVSLQAFTAKHAIQPTATRSVIRFADHETGSRYFDIRSQ